MILHIAKRELYDNMNSLRFILTVLLILTLMIANAVKHLGDYRAEMSIYRKNVAQSLDHLRSRSENLYDLVEKGPGNFYKQPSPLSFCADGGEAFLPDHVSAAEGALSSSAGKTLKESMSGINGKWRLKYPDENPNLRDIRPDYTQIDWVLVISVVLSFVAILFTFDAISGERERGTLRLDSFQQRLTFSDFDRQVPRFC